MEIGLFDGSLQVTLHDGETRPEVDSRCLYLQWLPQFPLLPIGRWSCSYRLLCMPCPPLVLASMKNYRARRYPNRAQIGCMLRVDGLE